MRLTVRDLLFAAINGAFIGILAPFIFANLAVKLPVHPLFFAFGLGLLAALGVAAGYFLSKFVRPFLFQLSKFGLIGITNTVIDLGIYNFFIFVSNISSGYLISGFKVVSVTAAIVNSYIWNKFWSFEKKETSSFGKEFVQFLLVSFVGMILNVAITSFVVNIIGAPAGFPEKAWANVGALTASILVLAWNFIGYKLFVFKK